MESQSGEAMAQSIPSKSYKANGGPPSLKVRFTTHAQQNLELRAIDIAEVEHALSSGAVSQVDQRTGHLVFKLGDIRVVARREEDGVVVMTAFRRAEFSEEAQ